MYQEILLSEIRPSPHNPRRKFDGKKFNELVESIRQNGVLEPILVRPAPAAGEEKHPCDECEYKRAVSNKTKGVKIPKPGFGKCTADGGLCDRVAGMADPGQVKYEIIAGERRWRASMAVTTTAGPGPEWPGIDDYKIPAIVRDVDDDTAFEMMTVENLQREDLSDLEEAQGFAAWVARKGENQIPELAERCGLSPRYIRRRIAVLALPDNILEAWNEGRVCYGHLEQFLRVKDDDTALQSFFHNVSNYGDTVSDIKEEIDSAGSPLGVHAVFDTAQCVWCSNNSASQMELFGLGDDTDVCYDPGCYKQKVNNHLMANLGELKEIHGTNGFIFEGGFRYGNHNEIHRKPRKECGACESLVSVFRENGKVWMERACIGPASCYKKVYERPAGSKNKQADGAGTTGAGEDSQDTPRVQWHGAFFREQFYKWALPERFSVMDPDAEELLRLTLFVLVRQCRGAEAGKWAVEHGYRDPEDPDSDGLYWFIESKELFNIIHNIHPADLKKEIASVVVRVMESSDFGAGGRHTIAPWAGVDLATEWVLTEDYLQKKTKAELQRLGEIELCGKPPVFQEPAAVKFMETVLGIKPDRYDTLKKPDLIRVFIESGIELTGRVPDEVLRADEYNPSGQIG